MSKNSKNAKNLGPIGSKLGTFIINSNLEIKDEYVALHQYDKYLKDSINTGLEWISNNVGALSGDKYLNLFERIKNNINKDGYTDTINQNIIELSYDILSKLNNPKTEEAPGYFALGGNSLKGSGSGRNSLKNSNSGNFLKKSNSSMKKSNPSTKNKMDAHLGTDNLDKLSITDVDLTRSLMVQVDIGRFVMFLYVRHLDHWDILPYEYIYEKIENFPSLLLKNN